MQSVAIIQIGYTTLFVIVQFYRPNKSLYELPHDHGMTYIYGASYSVLVTKFIHHNNEWAISDQKFSNLQHTGFISGGASGGGKSPPP